MTGQKLALEAGEILNDILNLPQIHSESKTNRTPVTLADFLIQINIMQTLTRLYPDDDFIGEEIFTDSKITEIENLLRDVTLYDKYSGLLNEFQRKVMPRYRDILFDIKKPGASPRLWITDPLDGTANFMKKNGQYGCSLALLEWDEQSESYWPIYGIIYAPHYQTFCRGEKIWGPCVEAVEGLAHPILYQADQSCRLQKLGKLNLKETLLELNPGGPVTRDSKRFGPNPLDPFLEKYYSRESFVKKWGSSVLGMLEVILANHVLYSSAMSIWDFAAAAYILLKAGGGAIRTDNATKMDRIDL